MSYVCVCMCVDDRRVSVQQHIEENASKEREKNRREKESERERKRERKILLSIQREEREGEKNVSGRKYLADQVDYWSCCSIRDDLNGNLSQNASHQSMK